MNENRTIWMRIGISLDCTPEEADAIMNGNGQNELSNILKQGRFDFDGEAYIPADSVAQYDNEYFADYETQDIEYYV